MAAVKLVHRVGKLVPESTVFLLCDLQERMASPVQCFTEICQIANRLVDAAAIMDIPVVATEQYPKGLGRLVKDFDTSKMQVFEKTLFSMKTPEVTAYLGKICPNLKSVVLFGAEAHVCVQQTALDFLEEGIEVHLPADGISSRSKTDRMFAIDRMRQSGAFITTHESILFMLLKDAKHPNFKDVQKLIINQTVDQGIV